MEWLEIKQRLDFTVTQLCQEHITLAEGLEKSDPKICLYGILAGEMLF